MYIVMPGIVVTRRNPAGSCRQLSESQKVIAKPIRRRHEDSSATSIERPDSRSTRGRLCAIIVMFGIIVFGRAGKLGSRPQARALRQFCQPRNATLTGIRWVARGWALFGLGADHLRPHRGQTNERPHLDNARARGAACKAASYLHVPD